MTHRSISALVLQVTAEPDVDDDAALPAPMSQLDLALSSD
jgi:hypothetical protein